MKNTIKTFALTAVAAALGSGVAVSLTTSPSQEIAPQNEVVKEAAPLAAHQDLESIRKTIQASLPATPIRSVMPSAIDGLYEVVTANGLMHTDKNGRYLFVGGIYDPKTNTDLIKERKAELGFSDKEATAQASARSNRPAATPPTPIVIDSDAIRDIDQYAVTYQEFEGAPVVYEIFDPMCGACRSNSKELAKLRVTVKKVLIPSVGSDEINQAVYCSNDPKSAIDSLMKSNSIISSSQPRTDCDVQDLVKIKQWMSNQNIPMATPQIILASTGELFRGANRHSVWKERFGL